MQTVIKVSLPLVVVVILGLVVFGLLLAFGVPQDFAKTAATLPLGAYPSIYKSLDERKLTLSLGISPDRIVRLNSFKLPYYVMTAAGALVFAGLSQFLALLSVLLGLGSAGGTAARVLMAYLIGRWIGIRCDRYRIIAAICAPLIGVAMGIIIDMIFASDEVFVLGYTVHKNDPYLGIIFVQGFITYAPFFILGLWVGWRRRYAEYSQYLLGKLPAETQTLVTDLLYDEVRRLTPEERTRPDSGLPDA